MKNTFCIGSNHLILRIIPLLFFILLTISAQSQNLFNVNLSDSSGLGTNSMTLSDSTTCLFIRNKPLFCFLLNDKYYSSSDVNAKLEGNQYSLFYENKLKVTFSVTDFSSKYWAGECFFENISADTLFLSNVVPFGTSSESVYITGYGPWDLARARLFRPGFTPVRVILPDNAWEMGYSSFRVNSEFSICAIARRQTTEGGQKQRYNTILPPGARVKYSIYADVFKGEWQNGLRLMFRDRYLYDLETFDNTLYERPDLAWIKESYLIVLQMAWDKDFYDRLAGKYTFPEVIKNGIARFGHVDVYGIWPTWPRLGLDQRNQWDMYRDLPGGNTQLRNFVRMSRQSGTKFFIAYNPWDKSTRNEDHYKGMAQLISETEADGVVLDTRGSSSFELQAAADSVRKGVVMYSEGMAVIKDMPGIISGRVHNAIYYSPELNLNKLIKPDFSIFRVCDIGEDLVHREIAIAFFNGYGTELNMFRPGGRDENYNTDLEYLANTTFILRQNNDAFRDKDWTPLIETALDNVFVNQWKAGDKTIYTILNMRSEGIDSKLFKVDIDTGKHYVSLWNHENVETIASDGNSFIPVRMQGWPISYSGTRKEGSIDCIAELPEILRTSLKGDSISINRPEKGKILIWKGNPSYQNISRELKTISDTVVSVKDLFGHYEGKIVIQLIENKKLIDENVLLLKGGKPWLVSKVVPTARALNVPPEMVLVPGTNFSFNVTTDEDFIPYPEVSGISVRVDSFLIDKFPVTNAQYHEFLINSGYRPADTVKYLRHWQSGIYKQGQDKYPVVYLSHEDMMAYAKWAGKRLPTQAEWQLAAQGPDKRKWPWGNDFHGTFCNNAFDRPTPVDAFFKGQSPYGAMDMVGNVWQMTNDMYFNGTYYFMIIRGGSFYNPDSSWWYIKGGPQPLDRTQIMLLVSPGFDRCSTVGFRCVKDIDRTNFKTRR